MGKNHAPRFLEIVAEAKQQVNECTVQDVKAKLDREETFYLVDVREEPNGRQAAFRGDSSGQGNHRRDIEKPFRRRCDDRALRRRVPLGGWPRNLQRGSTT
jgi:hypothetical protein